MDWTIEERRTEFRPWKGRNKRRTGVLADLAKDSWPLRQALKKSFAEWVDRLPCSLWLWVGVDHRYKWIPPELRRSRFNDGSVAQMKCRWCGTQRGC